MGVVSTKLSQLVTVSVVANGAEATIVPVPALINGNSQFPMPPLAPGDVIRFVAWGVWTLPNPGPQGTAQIRLYFLPVAAPLLANPIADTGVRVIIPPNRQGITFEWQFFADIII